MPGKRITDHQVHKYKEDRKRLTQVASAAKAGISERSARRVLEAVAAPTTEDHGGGDGWSPDPQLQRARERAEIHRASVASSSGGLSQLRSADEHFARSKGQQAADEAAKLAARAVTAEYERTGISVPSDVVLSKLEAKVAARVKQLRK